MATKKSLVVWIAALASASLAGEPPPPIPVVLEKLPAPYVLLGPLLVELEAATLPGLVETLGTGAIRHNEQHAHDGGGDQVCFSYRSGVIRFTSNTEMGGTRRSITDFAVETSSTSPAGCPMLPERFASVRVGGWLGIGDNRASVEHHLGSTAGRDSPRVLYQFAGFSPGPCPNVGLRAFDVSASLEISYRNDSVVGIKGSRLTAC